MHVKQRGGWVHGHWQAMKELKRHKCVLINTLFVLTQCALYLKKGEGQQQWDPPGGLLSHLVSTLWWLLQLKGPHMGRLWPCFELFLHCQKVMWMLSSFTFPNWAPLNMFATHSVKKVFLYYNTLKSQILLLTNICLVVWMLLTTRGNSAGKCRALCPWVLQYYNTILHMRVSRGT